jgi:hypothetical protein
LYPEKSVFADAMQDLLSQVTRIALEAAVSLKGD